MADLITHGLVAWLLPGRPGPWRYWVVTGAVLPDLVGRAPQESVGILIGYDAFVRPLGVVALACDILHLPVGCLLLATMISAALPSSRLHGLSRRRVAGALLAGSGSHLALDVLQHHVEPLYALLWPLSDRRWELGWLGTEDSLLGIPLLAAAAALVWWRRTGPPPHRS